MGLFDPVLVTMPHIPLEVLNRLISIGRSGPRFSC